MAIDASKFVTNSVEQLASVTKNCEVLNTI